MKEHPILFSAPMVRALLDGTKTQTRRVCKPAEAAALSYVVACEDDKFGDEEGYVFFGSPYGKPGDRLWVRETFLAYGRWETHFSAKKKRDAWHFVDMTIECDRRYQYAADNPDVPLAKGRAAAGALPGWHTRPAIFMPRAASRILLEIVSVRVERLNDCGEADARAEGITLKDRHMGGYCAGEYLPPAIRAYRELWESINGAGSWAANPWVWAVEFKRVSA